MARRRLRREEYTVGWVCALSVELTAAVVMLDERHEGLEQDDYDNNSYALGRIGKHNVVIACLPAGMFGSNVAAVVATQMMSVSGFSRASNMPSGRRMLLHFFGSMGFQDAVKLF